MTTTTLGKFNTVASAGANLAWSGLSNLTASGSGYAQCGPMSTSAPTANRIDLKVPEEVSTIPANSIFGSMQIQFELWKTEFFPSTVNMAVSLQLGSAGYTFPLTANSSWTLKTTSDGDRSYWGLNAYTPTEVMDYIISGVIFPKFSATLASGGASSNITLRLREVQCTITYTTPAGRGGAIVASVL